MLRHQAFEPPDLRSEFRSSLAEKLSARAERKWDVEGACLTFFARRDQCRPTDSSAVCKCTGCEAQAVSGLIILRFPPSHARLLWARALNLLFEVFDAVLPPFCADFDTREFRLFSGPVRRRSAAIVNALCTSGTVADNAE